MTDIDQEDALEDVPENAPGSQPDRAPAVTGPVWESRVVLAPRSPAALQSILGPDMRRQDGQFAHRMLWTLFPDRPAARREGLFLFHVEGTRPFSAIVRSRVPPEDGLGGVWTITTRPFEPALAPGLTLRFRLRAVASRWQPRPGERRGRRQDVIVAAWHDLPEEQRTPEDLEKAAEHAALDWLARQGRRGGFAPVEGAVEVLDYDRASLRAGAGRGGRDRSIRFGAVIYEGLLTVTDPQAFHATLVQGLGAGRAYGNGLMQIAPAR
ncbi:type I-E CRISPR-associated protein Cas6/Cse3/CasE [Rhodocista pekingensis]|uniref:Type I-E CRISPR-associated protein Cas6/Cse3/CasE n=1 Tax=Rhodocista pekingensis TaxID=201185 RepID=A0ABW2KZG2_9PROT